ncbi:MAG TPA: alpha/beta fold hydrolase [Deltaproteobacteria bacterium]|nr:alpha/beta fold hydrolase [Deltaproteobacteria bacterium]
MGENNLFVPPGYLKGTYMQTILASSRIRMVGANPMLDASQDIVLDAGRGVRLLGSYSPQPGRDSKGLAVLLHGWEGSSSSTYILHTGRYLYRMGCCVFRLNLRDHGQSHHLNEGLFYGTLLDEVFEAVRKACSFSQGRPAVLTGFSLGGNFALRIARRALHEPIDNLRHVVAISPALDPGISTDMIDSNLFLKWYFMRKWRRSLGIKQRLYPGLYNFSRILSMDTVRAMTDEMIREYGTGMYRNSEEYFRGYTLANGFFEDIKVPLTVVVSRDDPVIPVDLFQDLSLNPNTDLVVHDYGGHNGFVYGISRATWYEKRIAGIFSGFLETDSDGVI